MRAAVEDVRTLQEAGAEFRMIIEKIRSLRAKMEHPPVDQRRVA
jgi:hypothetical protein